MSTTPHATPVSAPYDTLAAYIRGAGEVQPTARLGEAYLWDCDCAFVYTTRGWVQTRECRKHAESMEGVTQ